MMISMVISLAYISLQIIMIFLTYLHAKLQREKSSSKTVKQEQIAAATIQAAFRSYRYNYIIRIVL